jgi:predicted murein hydrolase (TIGR00659 family)
MDDPARGRHMNDAALDRIWVFLSASPLAGLTVTLAAYALAWRLYARARFNPLLNPVAVAVVLLIALLSVAGVSYRAYFDGAKFVHFLLGPATVSLAIPLYKQLGRVRRLALPVAAGLVAGISSGLAIAVGVGFALGGSREAVLSLAPKSATAPVAMGVAEKIGGLPSLTAVLVVTTGIVGAVIGTRLFRLLGIRDDAVAGVAMGVTAHGIGTARAFQVSEEMGAFSGLAMAISAFLIALVLPWLLPLIGIAGGMP